MISLATGFLVALAGQPAIAAGKADEPADFKEVYDLIKGHLAGLSDTALDRAAVEGLVSALGPKVSLVTTGAVTRPASGTGFLVKSNLFDGDIAYLRIGKIDEGLAPALRSAVEQLGSSAKLKGLALDLRYARGDDYGAAASVADLFLKRERPLLNWGKGVVESKEKSDAITLPVAVLVNRQTAGAAEALAAILRETGAGLILGGKTAGQALIAQEFPLKNGDVLRIATTPVLLGDGTPMSTEGLAPDITVAVTPEQERVYYADAFKTMPKSDLLAGSGLSLSNNTAASTNRAARRTRLNEAELVRERREGLSLDTAPTDDLTNVREPEYEKPVVRDPTLARALDLLKGLAVVRSTRS
jgi:C-terminal processing protease CtpA/Prc